MIFHCKCQENMGSLFSGFYFISHLDKLCNALVMHKKPKMAAPITHHGSRNLKTKAVEDIVRMTIIYFGTLPTHD